LFYCDSSAITKLILHEAESIALRGFLGETQILVTSALSRTEVTRAVLRSSPTAGPRIAVEMAKLNLAPITDELLDAAGTVSPPQLRSLDAIHLASAVVLRRELDAFVSYDARQLEAASALGLPVASPGT
jgi:uncharacterized protein